jgi:hypothetical protein
MRVRRSEVSRRVSIQRDCSATVAKAMSSSRAGSGAGCGPGEGAVPARPGGDGGLDGQLARAGAALVDGCHGAAPVGRRLRALGFGHLDGDEFFGGGEGGRGDFGADGGGGPEGGRRSGGPGGGIAGGVLRAAAGHGGSDRAEGAGCEESSARRGGSFRRGFGHGWPQVDSNRGISLRCGDADPSTAFGAKGAPNSAQDDTFMFISISEIFRVTAG